MPIKLVQQDAKDGDTFKPPIEDFDLICAGCEYDYRILPSAFRVNSNRVKITGYPRNDIMLSSSKSDAISRVIRKHQFESEKKIILYAPTYRDYEKDMDDAFVFNSHISFNLFRKMLGDEYIMLVRAHGAIESNNIHDFVDVSSYPDVEDLLMMADILITDYSGILFDFSLLDKPIILFPYDLKTYEEKRGLYVNLETYFPFYKAYSEEDLYRIILNMDYEKECKKTEEFRKNVGLLKEPACKNVVNEIDKAVNC